MITFKVGAKSPMANGADEEGAPITSINLDVRKDVAGNYMIFDHGDMDIIVKPKDNVIICWAKDDMPNKDVVYDAQNRMFKFLMKKGAIDHGSIKGGPFLGSMQASFYSDEDTDEGINPVQVLLFVIGKFIEEEKPFYMFRQAYEDSELERLYDPDDEYSTELGEVPHAEEKGSIPVSQHHASAGFGVYESKGFYSEAAGYNSGEDREYEIYKHVDRNTKTIHAFYDGAWRKVYDLPAMDGETTIGYGEDTIDIQDPQVYLIDGKVKIDYRHKG